jgi:hypothetical protein
MSFTLSFYFIGHFNCYYHNNFLGSASTNRIIILFWKFDFVTFFFFWFFDKTSFKFKNIHMLFITNVLCKCFVSRHRFWFQILPAWNIALSTNIPLGIEKNESYYSLKDNEYACFVKSCIYSNSFYNFCLVNVMR